jgi:Uma2 family endonuclease
MVTTAIPSVQRVILKNISWQTFETLLEEMGEKRGSRLAYDNGILEVITPLMPHEYNNRVIHNLIVALADELNINLKSVGSVTCKRADLSRGVEPDSSFYIQNELLMRNKEELDLTKDPPPDLVLEVDFTSSSLDRLSIYAALGVPEIWRYEEGVLQIYRLQEGVYVPFVVSPTFGNLLLTEIPRFLEESLKIGEIPMMRSFRSWVRQQVG